ncbi:MAG TPA: DUF6273 domain-containing protein [Lachnoclostridium phocaeense]|uniref:DUF6273 domain-containing protein n=1 Tax=Lachnoclostridium phocaeense TaxID=1871021 RepID=A0A921HYV1_9FIRM|nr:DUF6273 domain-containing protein [Lachnoclostridium phocaeense]
MKKRITALLLSLLMVLTVFPVTTWAAEGTGSVGSTMGYLNETERQIYTQLKSIIEQQAVTGGRMQFWVTGLSIQVPLENGTGEDAVNQAVSDYIDENINTIKIFSCLVLDLPYHMYWYDKMSGFTTGVDYSVDGTTARISALQYKISVYETYQGTDPEGLVENKYYLSPQAAERAEGIVAYAKQIVEDNKDKSDSEKLKAYKDIICELTAYNQETSDIASNPDNPLYDTYYGDPFQLLYVFDQNPDTKVVGEGYCKAFQYLCDLSTFNNTQVYSVTGTMEGSDISGGHMWNIVRYNGKNYMVDVMNCDEEWSGYPDYYFMASPESGSVSGGYTFTDKNEDSFKLTYSADDVQIIYPDSILNLDPDKTYMYGTVSVTGTPKIGETLTAVTEDTPSGASLTYQWYRDDTPVSGANGRTYTPSEAEDVGKIIKVAVGADGYEDSLTAQTSGTVAKADATAATTVKVLSITKDSIRIETVSGYAYACKPADGDAPSADDEWQETGEFTGLTPNTKYYIYWYIKETPTHNASPVVYGEITTAIDDEKVLSSAHATLNGPVKNQPLPDVSVDTPYISASVQWYEGSDKTGTLVNVGDTAKAGQEYVAYVTIKTDDGYTFNTTGGFTMSVTGEGRTGLEQEGSATATQFTLKVSFKPTEAKALSGIEITTQPDKTDYQTGDSFDPDGMVVTAHYDDGSSETVTDYTVSPGEMAADTTVVTVAYNGFTADIPVTVSARPVSSAELSLDAPVKSQELDSTVTVTPDMVEAAVEWYEGDSMEGAPVTGNAKGGQTYMAAITLTLPEGYVFDDGFTAALNGEDVQVSVSLGGATITKVFPATEERSLTGIEVTKMPDKTAYDVGDSFDPSGMTVTAVYDDGTTEEVTGYTVSPEKMEEDTTAVTVTYNGFTAEVPVTVISSYIETAALSLDAPVKNQELDTSVTVTSEDTSDEIRAAVEWYEGDTASGSPVTGKAKVSQVYTAVITLTAPEGYAFDDGFEATLNEENVSVSVSGNTATVTKVFPATEERALTGIEVTRMPDKTDYKVGENFDPAGMTVTASYDDGSTEEVTGYTCSPEVIGEDTTQIEISYEGQTAFLPLKVYPASGGVSTAGRLPVGAKIIMGSSLSSDSAGEELYSETGDSLSWIIVDQSDVYKNGGTTLLSEFTLRVMAFSESDAKDNYNYRTSDVRHWLQDTFPSYLSAEELPYVLDTTYKCTYAPGGNKIENLTDKFFLLSLQEVGCNKTTDPWGWNHMRDDEGVKLEYFDDTQIESETRTTRGPKVLSGNWWLRSLYATYGYQNSIVSMATGRIDDRISPGYRESVRPACNINSYTPVVESKEHPGYYELYQPVLDSVSLNQDSASMKVGETLKLEPTFHGAGGAQVPTEEQGVTWTSSDPEVVMVDVNGNIRALKEGTAAITVTTDVGQKTAVCNVTVGHSPVKTEGKAATCTEEGSREYYSCSSCGKFFEDEACTKEIADIDTWRVIAPLDHSFTDYVYNNDATCTADGTETAKCDRCDATDTRVKASTALGHNTVKTEAKAATCTEDGNKEYWTCEICGKYFSDEELAQEIEKEETVIEAKGHGETELKNAKEATCTSEGYTGDKVCRECGEVLEKGEVIPMLAHSYKDGKCTECGAADPDHKPAAPTDQTASGGGKDGGEKAGNTPRTGDYSNAALWLALLAASGCILTGVFAHRRWRKY